MHAPVRRCVRHATCAVRTCACAPAIPVKAARTLAPGWNAAHVPVSKAALAPVPSRLAVLRPRDSHAVCAFGLGVRTWRTCGRRTCAAQLSCTHAPAARALATAPPTILCCDYLASVLHAQPRPRCALVRSVSCRFERAHVVHVRMSHADYAPRTSQMGRMVTAILQPAPAIPIYAQLDLFCRYMH
jgi:hypothetical protein